MREKRETERVFDSLPGGRRRLVVAVLVSLALHAALISLPAPAKGPPAPQAAASFPVLPMEMARGISGASGAPGTLDPGNSASPDVGAPSPSGGSSPEDVTQQQPADESAAGTGAIDSTPDEGTPPEAEVLPISPGLSASVAPGLPGQTTASSAGPGVAADSTAAGGGEEGTSPTGPTTPGSEGGSNFAGGTPGATGAGPGDGGGIGTPGGVFVPASVIYGPEPAYPDRAIRRGEEGAVHVRAQVLATGAVGKVEVVSSPGYPDLEEAAVECLRKEWKFAPATRDGRLVEDEVVIGFNFGLE